MIKPLPILMDMPDHIKEKIFEEVGDFEKRSHLRLISKPLKSFIDSIPLHVEHLSIFCHADSIQWNFKIKNNQKMNSIEYSDHLDGCLIKKECPKNSEKILKNQNFFEIAATDLSVFLANPKLKIDNFKVILREHFFIDQFLKLIFGGNLKNLRVKNFEFNSRTDVNLPKFLNFISPKSIKSMNIQSDLPINPHNSWNSATWQSAKNVEISRVPEVIPMEKLENFEIIAYETEVIKLEDFEMILEHFLNSSSIRRYTILFTEFDRDQLKPLLETEDLKIIGNEKFRREFKYSNGSSFTVSLYCNTVVFARKR